LIIRRLIAPLSIAVVALHAGAAGAQGAFPAPLPNQAAQPANSSPFPPANGAPAASPFPPAGAAAPSPFPSAGAPPMGGGMGGGGGFGPPQGPTSGPSDACMKGFIPLREDAEKKGKLIKAASDRKAQPDEACKLIANFGQAEVKMIKYIETNGQKCGIPPQIAEQLKAGHKNTEALREKVCNVAQQMAQQKAAAAPSLSEALGSVSGPEVQPTKKGGSTFDTLNGNVLAR
jgi:hypothetical protein